MQLRVCILVQENVLHWAPYYVHAFRKHCEVLTVGPGLDKDRLNILTLEHADDLLEPNDIVTDIQDAPSVMALLPPNWTPHLVVTIQSGGPGWVNVAKLACPTAYISVDTWHESDEFTSARSSDFVFVAQRVFEPYMKETGSRNAHWLPLACSPEHHFPVPMEPEADVVFVGSTKYAANEQRMQRLSRLDEKFSVVILDGVGGPVMCGISCRGRLTFNSSIAEDLNMRVFEVLAMGQPLLTNRDAEINGLLDLFEDGKHLITYTDEDLVETVRSWLALPEEYKAIGQAGRTEVLARHTYEHRVLKLLETIALSVPRFGEQDYPLLRDGERLSAYLPYGAQTLVDIGMSLDRSKIRLHSEGIPQVIGVSLNAQGGQKRQGSYDTVLAWEGDPTLSALATMTDNPDLILWTAPVVCYTDLGQTLAKAHLLLSDGGTLILRLSDSELSCFSPPDDFESWYNWLYTQNFHLNIFHLRQETESWNVMVMKKFARTVHEVSKEIFQRFPGGNLSNNPYRNAEKST
jgi:hypothetical protein